MPNVYVVNRGPHDYSPARTFGTLCYCTDGSVDRWDISQMYRELSSALAESEACDYLLLTSLATLCSVASAIFASKHGRLNLLLYKDDRYIERTIVINNEDNNGNK